jgi:hypothetical protein
MLGAGRRRATVALAVAAAGVAADVGEGRLAHAQPAGSNTASFRLGPAIEVIDAGGQILLGFDYAFALSTSGRTRLYASLPFEFGLGGGLTRIQMLPGVQGDVHLPVRAPVYVVPQAGVGIGIFPRDGGGRNDVDLGLGIRVGVEFKYVIEGSWNLSFTPFRMDMFPFTDNADTTPVWYEMLFGVGLNF